MAVLAPVGPDLSRQATAQVVEQMKRFRAGVALGDLTVSELVREGRR